MTKMTCCLAVLAALLCAIHCQDIRDVELRESEPYPNGTTENDGPSGITHLARLKRAPLCLPTKRTIYKILVRTSDSTDGTVKMAVIGACRTWKHELDDTFHDDFEAGHTDLFVDYWQNVGARDPVLFSGTLRMNLDPFDEYTDNQLWTALDRAHLRQCVVALPGHLAFQCGEEGGSLSVGQRQLVCLARTLLRRTKILVLDEATAAVDMETDALIQNTIRSAFRHCTVITIAHRLNTIMDYDKILVMSGGRIEEFAPPNVLLADKTSTFFCMARDAGLV